MWRNTDQRMELKPKMAPKLGLHIPHKSKSTSNEHVKECQCEISENILRKWTKFGILIYGPVFYTSLKVAQIGM